MSLKFFHMVFIVISILLAFFFGFWSLQGFYAGESVYLYYAVGSFLSGIILVFYGNSVLRKLKNVGFFIAPLFFCAVPAKIWACSTCYGDPNNPTSRALMASVLFLLGTVGLVLSGFLALIYNYNRRTKK